MLNRSIGERIRQERKKQGLTMAQLGENMGISGSLVGRYERGEENPKVKTIERFADALGVEFRDLISDENQLSCVEALSNRSEKRKGGDFVARKRLTVLEWLNTIGHSSGQIETVICFGSKEICKGRSPQWLASHALPGPLEAALQYVTITQGRITIQAKPKDTTL